MRHLYPDQAARYRQVTAVFLVLLLGYFSFHLLLSKRSIPALYALERQQAELAQTLDAVRDEKQKLALKVQGMRPETLDHDLLSEQSLKMLGRDGAGDVILIEPGGRNG